MTSKAWTWRGAIAKSNLEPTTRHVLLTLSLHFNEHGAGAFPKYDTLAEETGLSRKTVIVHIEKALQAGWIKKTVRRVGPKEYRSNIYEATTPENSLISGELKGVADTPNEKLMSVSDDQDGVKQLHHNIPSNIPNKKYNKKEKLSLQEWWEIKNTDKLIELLETWGIKPTQSDLFNKNFKSYWIANGNKKTINGWERTYRNRCEWVMKNGGVK